MPIVQIADRTVILVEGPEAETLLQNVITTDISALGRAEALPGALLTPQGKILFDFLVSRIGEQGFRLDCRAETAADFFKRLMLYRLRAKAEISMQDQEFVSISWGDSAQTSQTESDSVIDRRFPDECHVRRHYGPGAAADAQAEDWHRLRVEHGVAESGSDYALGDAFPHDVLFDQNGGVGLKKGCFVGQEVVSRMQHRGTARRRLVIVSAEAPLPESGTAVTADGRTLGTLGTVCDGKGLAIVRIDRAADALESGKTIEAGGVALALAVPAYANFTLERGNGTTETA